MSGSQKQPLYKTEKHKRLSGTKFAAPDTRVSHQEAQEKQRSADELEAFQKLNDELIEELRKKYSNFEDREYLGIIDKEKRKRRSKSDRP